MRADVVSGVLAALEQVTVRRLAAGEEMLLPGVGRIILKRRAARVGRNPRTGEVFDVAATCRPVLKPMKALRDAASSSVETQ